MRQIRCGTIIRHNNIVNYYYNTYENNVNTLWNFKKPIIIDTLQVVRDTGGTVRNGMYAADCTGISAVKNTADKYGIAVIEEIKNNKYQISVIKFICRFSLPNNTGRNKLSTRIFLGYAIKK